MDSDGLAGWSGLEDEGPVVVGGDGVETGGESRPADSVFEWAPLPSKIGIRLLIRATMIPPIIVAAAVMSPCPRLKSSPRSVRKK
jgi:hypothetical protein